MADCISLYYTNKLIVNFSLHFQKTFLKNPKTNKLIIRVLN